MTGPPPFDTSLPSPLARLAELRASAAQAVVRGTDASGVRGMSRVQRLMARWGIIEEALWDLAGQEDGPRLIVLTGSAGSGKTAAIEHLLERDRSSAQPRFGRQLADATHADAPDEEQVERLADFFAPLADGCGRPYGPCSLIAMNTGMALRFFGDLASRGGGPSLQGLEALLRERLGLPATNGPRAAWLDEAVLVVNLDQRPTAGQPGDLFESILARLDPEDEDGVLEGSPRCATCGVREWCWPMANASALSRGSARAALNAAAGQVALARGRELPPRALWDAAARLALSGLDAQAGQDPCFEVARLAARGDITPVLEGLACHAALQGDADGPLIEALGNQDPSYQATPEAHALLSDLGLDPAEDARRLESWLGTHAAVTAAAAAVRLGQVPVPRRLLARSAWLGGHLEPAVGVPEPFEAALRAQSEGAQPGDAGGPGTALLDALQHVANGLGAAFGVTSGPETFFPTEARGPRLTEVLVKADLVGDGLVWTAAEGDPARARNPRGAELVGYRSLALAFVVAGEVALAVDLPLWSLLQGAISGTSPSTVDLDRFLGLRRAVEAVGRQAGNNPRLPLLVTHRKRGVRYRVAPFGPTTTLRATEVP